MKFYYSYWLLVPCSVPAKFVMGSRHVKETLESLFDEYNWLGEQWSRRNATLQRALTYNLFLDETKKVSLPPHTDLSNTFTIPSGDKICIWN